MGQSFCTSCPLFLLKTKSYGAECFAPHTQCIFWKPKVMGQSFLNILSSVFSWIPKSMGRVFWTCCYAFNACGRKTPGHSVQWLFAQTSCEQKFKACGILSTLPGLNIGAFQGNRFHSCRPYLLWPADNCLYILHPGKQFPSRHVFSYSS